MDLHIVGPAATADEREAVDAALDPAIGPARAGWDGGTRDAELEGHVARGGHEARERRDLLLPALEAAVARVGWLTRGALNHVCRRLSVPPAEAYGVASFYALLPMTPRPPVVAHVCDDIACRLGGAEVVCRGLEGTLGAGDGQTRAWIRSPCLGVCDVAPAALVTVAGERPTARTVTHIREARDVITALDTPGVLAADTQDGASLPAIPQAGDPKLRLLARVGRVDPASIDAYRAAGGYGALGRALQIGADAVIEEVTAARLVGRGGAAFPTGRKWAAVAAQTGAPKLVVCNADESEPGTFKDRVLLEGDPFAVIEGMTIEAFAVGASRGYLYLRGEYPRARERVARAILAAQTTGLLGNDVADSGWAFDVELRVGAGAYIAGEETALFESIEGRRPEPRNKPPFPVEFGLFGRPTAVNNVETLVNVSLVLALGAEAYARIGTAGSTGPKLFCLSGNVARPGVYEVEFGATVRELIALAGGVPGGREIRAVLLGGAAGVFVGPDALDLPLTFEDARAAGATIGSGVVMVFDATADLADTVRRIAAFFRDESCGQCVPCRVGTVRQEEVLARLVAARPLGSVDAELARLADVGLAMRDASICGLGQTASSAIESALRLGLVRFDRANAAAAAPPNTAPRPGVPA